MLYNFHFIAITARNQSRHIITNKDTITNNKCFTTNHIIINILNRECLIKDLQDKRYLLLLHLHLLECILIHIILSITRCHRLQRR